MIEAISMRVFHGDPFSLVPFKRLPVFPCTRTFPHLLPALLICSPFTPRKKKRMLSLVRNTSFLYPTALDNQSRIFSLQDSRLSFVVWKSFLLTDTLYMNSLFAFGCSFLIRETNRTTSGAVTTDSNFKWPMHCCFLLPITINHRSNCQENTVISLRHIQS